MMGNRSYDEYKSFSFKFQISPHPIARFRVRVYQDGDAGLPIRIPVAWEQLRSCTREDLINLAARQDPESAAKIMDEVCRDTKWQACIVYDASKKWMVSSLAYLKMMKKGMGATIAPEIKTIKDQLIDTLWMLKHEAFYMTPFYRAFVRLLQSHPAGTQYRALLTEVTDRIEEQIGLQGLYRFTVS
jgi:hypothetical protein